MNKKADYLLAKNTLLVLYKFLLIAIVVVFIVIFVLAFFYRDYDVRPIEASILASKIADCYIHNGQANLNDFNSTPREKCNISAGESYFADIFFVEGFPQVACGDLNGKWTQDECSSLSSASEDKRIYVTDMKELESHKSEEKWKCCIEPEKINPAYVNIAKRIIRDGKNEEDLRVICGMKTKPESKYLEGCLVSNFYFILTSKKGKSPAIIEIRTGLPPRE